MAEPFLGEIRLFPINYAPRGWAACNGQLLDIRQNTALYALLGTTYGGNGTTTFALPDLRGRVPLHSTLGKQSLFPLGLASGEASHTLTINEMPMHTHNVSASSTVATSTTPQGNVWAQQTDLYHANTNIVNMNAGSLAKAGGSLPHNNMQPYLAIEFCIATSGIFPPRS